MAKKDCESRGVRAFEKQNKGFYGDFFMLFLIFL